MTKGVLSVGGLGLGGHHTTKKFIVRRLQLHYEMRCITEQMLSRDSKTAFGHTMPPPLHLSEIRCKCFSCRRCHGKQITLLKGAVNEQTHERVYVILFNSVVYE